MNLKPLEDFFSDKKIPDDTDEMAAKALSDLIALAAKTDPIGDILPQGHLLNFDDAYKMLAELAENITKKNSAVFPILSTNLAKATPAIDPKGILL